MSFYILSIGRAWVPGLTESDILTLVGTSCSVAQWIRDMTLQGMHPVTGKVQVTSLLPHRPWHSVLNFMFWIMQALNDKRKVLWFMKPPYSFYFSSEAKIRWESRHCIPSERYTNSLKKCMTTVKCHVQPVKHRLGSLLLAVILKNKTTAESISVALCMC